MKNLAIALSLASATSLPSYHDYNHFPKSCVAGNKISGHHGKSLAECSDLCNKDPNCKIFQYGVAYGGKHGNIKPGYCILKSSNNRQNCDGEAWNVDVYEKPFAKQTAKFNATKNGESGIFCLN